MTLERLESVSHVVWLLALSINTPARSPGFSSDDLQLILFWLVLLFGFLDLGFLGLSFQEVDESF